MRSIVRGFVVSASVLVAPAGIVAQTPATPPAQPAAKPLVVRLFESYSQRVLTAAEAMPEEAYESRLAPGVRSFAEAVGHSVDTNFGVCAGARSQDSPKKGINHEQSVHGKTALLTALRDAFAYCTPFVAEAAAAGTHASDVAFVNTHNAQMLVLMEAQLIARGLTPAKGSEAVAPVKK
jgi:hypothetical protein